MITKICFGCLLGLMDGKFALRSHHEETKKLLGEKLIMHGTMPGACMRGKPPTAWMDNINTWTGLSVEESNCSVRYKVRTKPLTNCNILCAVTRNVEGKWKIENNDVHQWLLAYKLMFTKFGRGRLNSDGDRRGSLCGGGENKILRFLT